MAPKRQFLDSLSLCTCGTWTFIYGLFKHPFLEFVGGVVVKGYAPNFHILVYIEVVVLWTIQPKAMSLECWVLLPYGCEFDCHERHKFLSSFIISK